MFLGRAIGHIPSPYVQETRDYMENIRANGGGIQVSSLQAIDLFIRTCKDAGFWGDLMEVYPFCGNDLTSALVKLKYASNPLLTAVNMVAADYVETGASGGIAGNGTTKYINSNFPQNGMGLTAHMSVYLRENEANTGIHYWFAANTSTPTIEQTILGTPNGSVQQGMLGSNSATATSAGAPNAGFYYVERNSQTDLQLWYQNASVASSSLSTTPAYQNLNLFICGRNANGAPNNYSAKKISFCSVGVPLTAQERTTFYNAVVALQTALNRNV
jgi:hypothetical protein